MFIALCAKFEYLLALSSALLLLLLLSLVAGVAVDGFDGGEASGLITASFGIEAVLPAVVDRGPFGVDSGEAIEAIEAAANASSCSRFFLSRISRFLLARSSSIALASAWAGGVSTSRSGPSRQRWFLNNDMEDAR